MGVTIYDVSREAGVGIGTVSRVLNNSPDVSEATRKKVLAVAQRLHYEPHAYARGLALDKTRTVSVILPSLANYFFFEILSGAQDSADELGYDLIVNCVGHPGQAEGYVNRFLRRGRVDGILFFSMPFPEALLGRFQRHKVPLVLVDRYHPSFDSYIVDNETGAYIATKYLLELGRQPVGMVNANPSAIPAAQRYEGFLRAIREAGECLALAPVQAISDGRNDGFNRDSGYKGVMKFFNGSPNPKPSGLFIASDIQAVGALEALRQLDLRVPEDVAVVGFDGIEIGKHLGLTTMEQPMYEMGKLAVRRLVERISQPNMPPMRMTFTPELVIRRTTGKAEPK